MPQQVFEVTAPSGQVLEITGDRLPTEAELRQIFKAAGVEAERRTHTTESGLASIGEIAASKPEGSATRRFASNLGEMINPISIATGLYHAARHPIETGKQIVAQQGAELSKARDLFGQGRYTEAAGHGAAGLLPVMGPLAAQAGEQIAAGDVAGGLGKAAGVLVPFGAGEAVARAGAKAIPKRVATALERRSASNVADTMSPRANTNIGRRMGVKAQKIAPELSKDADITTHWTRTGLHEAVKAKLADAEAGLDAANDARLSARTFQTEPIIRDLVEKRREFVPQPVEASKATPRIVPPAAADIEAAKASQVAVKTADRNFALQWLSDDLREMPFQAESRMRGPRAQEAWKAAASNEEFNQAAYSPRVAGTPTQEMFHAVGIKGTRAEIAARIQKYVAGKKKDPKLNALGDALVEVFDGEKFNWAQLSDASLKKLGVRRRDLKNPMTGPNAANTPPEVMARWFPKQAEEGVTPLTELPMPQPSKVAEPFGKEVVPAPMRPRVAMIDRAIEELQALGPAARYEDIRKIRQAYDQPAKVVYNPAVTPNYLRVRGKADGAADVTGTIRQHLAKWDPQTAEANAAYSLYKSATDILDASAEIERVRPKVGRQIMARLTGVVFGGQQAGAAGAAAGYVLGPIADQALASGITTKLQSARLMQGIAVAIRRGDVGRVNSLSFKLRQLVKQAEAVRGQSEPQTDSGSPLPIPEGIQ